MIFKKTGNPENEISENAIDKIEQTMYRTIFVL
jgi:hypothetical protein